MFSMLTCDNRGRGHHSACHCCIDLTADVLRTSSLLSFFCLLRCFKPSDTTRLPDPRGPLPTKVSSSSPQANAGVIETQESNADWRKRGCYEKFSPELCDSCHSSISNRLLAGFSQLFPPVLTRFDPWHMCSKRRSVTLGEATLDCPSTKIKITKS